MYLPYSAGNSERFETTEFYNKLTYYDETLKWFLQGKNVMLSDKFRQLALVSKKPTNQLPGCR
jgi:hypothetical protein